MNRVRLTIFTLILLLQGCATPIFIVGNMPEVQKSNIVFSDVRNEYSKKGGKHSITDTFFYHPDESIVPSKITLLTNALQSIYGEETELRFTLIKFDVLDHYPNRLGASRSASLASLSPILAAHGADYGSDFISCEIQIEINNVRYSSGHTAPYELTDNFSMVTGQEPYKNAVRETIQKSLEKLLSKLKG
jgi:hypothetical protein